MAEDLPQDPAIASAAQSRSRALDWNTSLPGHPGNVSSKKKKNMEMSIWRFPKMGDPQNC